MAVYPGYRSTCMLVAGSDNLLEGRELQQEWNDVPPVLREQEEISNLPADSGKKGLDQLLSNVSGVCFAFHGLPSTSRSMSVGE